MNHQKDPADIDSYTLVTHLPSTSDGVEVMKMQFLVEATQFPGNEDGKPVLIDQLIKTLDTERSDLGYEEPEDIKHPNILPYLHWQKNSMHYVATPFMGLGSLRDILPLFACGMQERHIAFIIKQVAEGLKIFHHEGLLHKDIKLGNVLMHDRKAGPIKLCKSFYGPSLTSLNIIDTTNDAPYWIPPEQKTEEYKKSFTELPDLLLKSDIWSLGILAMELACGGPPTAKMFDHMTKTMFDRIGRKLNFRTSSKRRALSDNFKSFVRICLANDPSDRPAIDVLLTHDFLASHNLSTGEDLIDTVLTQKALQSSAKISHWVLGQNLLMRPTLHDHSMEVV